MASTHENLDHHDAAQTLLLSLDLAREIGDRTAESYALNHLGGVHQALGDTALSAERYRRALRIARDIGMLVLQADVNGRANAPVPITTRPGVRAPSGGTTPRAWDR